MLIICREFEEHGYPEDINDNPDGPIDACCPASPFRRFGVNFCDRLCDNYIEASKYDVAFKQIKQHR
jgi:hypothetical protein